MLIINTLAIDLEWVAPFDDKETRGLPFYKDNGEEMIATTLCFDYAYNKNISYYIDNDITVLTMDFDEYDKKQFEFMAIMPQENLSDYVENISKEQINQIDKNLQFELHRINVRIPKFKFDYDLKLKDDLIKLGIKDAFNQNSADFSKMVDLEKVNSNMYITDALHKADIEFTEKGVKAAAVTIIMGGFNGMGGRLDEPVDIIINKPFMFIIRDKNTKDIWFTGTVYEPNLWESNKSSNLF